MEKQKWVNENAINDWELEHTQKSARIVENYWKEDNKKWEVEEAKNILKEGKPWKDF